MWRLVLVDWRRLLAICAAGALLWGIVLSMIVRDFRACCPDGAPVQATKLLFVCLVYGQFPLILWLQIAARGAYLRQRITDVLPLSVRQLNVLRLTIALLLFLAGLVLWELTVLVWLWFRQPIAIWLFPATALLVAAFTLLSLRNLFPRVAIGVLLPLVVVPGAEQVLRIPLQWLSTPWPTLALLALVIPWSVYVIRRSPPRWTR